MSEWAWVAQADDEFSPACADRRHQDCTAEDCVCACHIDDAWDHSLDLDMYGGDLW